MQNINSEADIRIAIRQLEQQQAIEWPLLRTQFLATYEGLKPLNILKNSIKDFKLSPDLKEDLLGTTMGLTAGYLSKKLLVGDSQNPLKKILGTVIELGISNIVSRNPEFIKSIINSITNLFLQKEEPKENNNEHSL
jgi:hypothetical protein